MTTAESTIRNLQDTQADLLAERKKLLLEIAELKSEAEILRAERSQALRIIGRSSRKNASASFCRHLLTCVEGALSESRRVA